MHVITQTSNKTEPKLGTIVRLSLQHLKLIKYTYCIVHFYARLHGPRYINILQKNRLQTHRDVKTFSVSWNYITYGNALFLITQICCVDEHNRYSILYVHSSLFFSSIMIWSECIRFCFSGNMTGVLWLCSVNSTVFQVILKKTTIFPHTRQLNRLDIIGWV